MAELTAPNGATVSAADDKVPGLLRRGFKVTSPDKPAKKAAPKKVNKK